LTSWPRGAAAQASLYFSQNGGIWSARSDGSEGTQIGTAFEPRGLAIADKTLFWTDVEPRVPITPTGVIRGAALDGRDVHTFARDLPLPSGIQVALSAEMVYWSDLEGHAIFRRPIDGASPAEQVLGGDAEIAQIHGLALDEGAGQLYFGYVNPLIDGLFPGAIARVNLDGSGLENVVSGLIEPWGIGLDLVHQNVYWSDSNLGGGGVISRADLDGNLVETIIEDLSSPRGLTIDPNPGLIFWADPEAGLIARADLNGQDRLDLITDLDQPHAVALFLVPEPSAQLLAVVGGALVIMLFWWPRRSKVIRKRSD
jgi:hypothetical protein